ncbi:MAG: adenosylhomocysteinase, partial [Candidatus Caldarchaeum sp.]
MTEPFHVKDLSLAEKGANRIMLAESMMPVLSLLRRKYADEKPFEGYRVSMCLHVTKETAVLCRVLREGGAKV